MPAVEALCRMPRLKRLVPHPMFGGVPAGSQAPGLDRRGEDLADRANQRRGLRPGTAVVASRHSRPLPPSAPVSGPAPGVGRPRPARSPEAFAATDVLHHEERTSPPHPYFFFDKMTAAEFVRLIVGLVRGSPQAWGELVRTFEPILLRFLRKCCDSPTVRPVPPAIGADDIAGDMARIQCLFHQGRIPRQETLAGLPDVPCQMPAAPRHPCRPRQGARPGPRGRY